MDVQRIYLLALTSARVDPLTALAISARDGNRLSLGAFIRQTQADIWRVCSRLGPSGMADDLTQEVYIHMMRSLPLFRGDSSAKTWLIAIARNTAIDALRTHKRRERLHLLLGARANVIENLDHSVEIVEMIATLEYSQREAFVLTQLLGLSYEEAAEVCDCPIGTIRSRVARARNNLIQFVEVDVVQPQWQ